MNATRWSALLLSLALASARGAEPSAGWTVSDPVSHQNLAVHFIRGKDSLPGRKFLSLQEALELKKAVVHETGDVNRLAVENVSEEMEVFIQAGDIVKGGRQDRVLAYDLILPPKSGKVALSSFCVEANRWRQRGSEDDSRFSGSGGQLPGKALRMAVSSARRQGQVWDKVKEQQDKLGRRLNKNVADPRSPTSLQLTLEDKDLNAKVNAYVAKLEKAADGMNDAIGFAVSINGKLEGAEVYGSSALFRRMWPKMLRAAAVDAFVEQQQGRRYEMTEVEEVKPFLAEGGKGKATETEVNDRVRVTTREGGTVLSIESRDRNRKDALIHRSLLAR